MAEIWAHNSWYSFLRPYVDACTRASYRSLKIKGRLPQDGAVIIAPNHTNALMDALVVLQTRRSETVFGARADIFRQSTAAKVLRFLRILPMTRERDGLHSVVDNYRTFEEVEGTLQAGVPFCIFPEGRHHTERTVLPITKGIARMALRSAASRKSYIVPTGINLSHFFRYRSACELEFGDPIDINGLVAAHPELSEQQLYLTIREELHHRLERLVKPEPIANPKGWRWALLPLWPLAAILSLPVWGTAELVCHKIPDPAFNNTARFGARLLLGPVIFLIWALVFFLTLPWWAAVGLLLLYIPSYSLFYDFLT